MATYDVTFATDSDSSEHGRPGQRTFRGIEAKSAKQAVEVAYPKLVELIRQGYVTSSEYVTGVKGTVERDTYRGAANTQVAGFRSTFGVRRGGQFSQPTWNFIFIVHTGPIRWETKLEKVQ
jgi:hypothetical protein